MPHRFILYPKKNFFFLIIICKLRFIEYSLRQTQVRKLKDDLLVLHTVL